MLLVVNDACSASSQRPTLAEKMITADVWARLLFATIPESRLQDCFDLAFRNHTSTFPVNAYDLKNAWSQLSRVGCDVCRNHPNRKLVSLKTYGWIFNTETRQLEDCICKNGTA
jgi:hypothetical protein